MQIKTAPFQAAKLVIDLSIDMFNMYFKGVSREWHKEYPETYEDIKHDKKEVIRQNIILEICNSHFDFYEDLIHVKKGIVLITHCLNIA